MHKEREEKSKSQSPESSRMLAFFVDFEENQLFDGDGCNW
jgi:hypothetical protein